MTVPDDSDDHTASDPGSCAVGGNVDAGESGYRDVAITSLVAWWDMAVAVMCVFKVWRELNEQ